MRNDEQVPDLDFANYFALKSGKFYEWKDEGTKKTQFNNYRNLSNELGLIKTIDNRMYITPLGYKFIMQLPSCREHSHTEIYCNEHVSNVVREFLEYIDLIEKI